MFSTNKDLTKPFPMKLQCARPPCTTVHHARPQQCTAQELTSLRLKLMGSLDFEITPSLFVLVAALPPRPSKFLHPSPRSRLWAKLLAAVLVELLDSQKCWNPFGVGVIHPTPPPTVRGAEKTLFLIFDCGYIFFCFTHKNIKFCVLGFNLDG